MLRMSSQGSMFSMLKLETSNLIHYLFRWMKCLQNPNSNQVKQLSSRYLTIDLEQLVKAAVNAVCARGEHDCNIPSATIVIRPSRCLAVTCQVPRLRDIKDGNKASNTIMDNGALRIIRLPCPVAGPIYYIDLHIMQHQPKVARARSKVLTVAEIRQF